MCHPNFIVASAGASPDERAAITRAAVAKLPPQPNRQAANIVADVLRRASTRLGRHSIALDNALSLERKAYAGYRAWDGEAIDPHSDHVDQLYQDARNDLIPLLIRIGLVTEADLDAVFPAAPSLTGGDGGL